MVKNLLPGRISITWTITGMVVAVIVVFACSAITIVYQFVARALHEQIDQRAVAIATSLSDGVAGSVTSANALLLHASKATPPPAPTKFSDTSTTPEWSNGFPTGLPMARNTSLIVETL